jgi:hypothetical protein
VATAPTPSATSTVTPPALALLEAALSSPAAAAPREDVPGAVAACDIDPIEVGPLEPEAPGPSCRGPCCVEDVLPVPRKPASWLVPQPSAMALVVIMLLMMLELQKPFLMYLL